MKREDEKPTFFVSRRGRHIGVHEVDMSGIDIESPTETSKPINHEIKRVSTPVPRQQTTKPKRDRVTWSNRKRVTVLGAIVAILLLPLFLAELVTAQYSTGVSNAKTGMNELIKTSVLPAQKKSSIPAENIRSIALEVNDIASQMCRGGLIDNIARLYPRAKTAHDTCKETQNKYLTLTNNLYVFEAQARYLEKVDVIIKPIATPISDAYAVIGAQQEAWKNASEGLKKLNPPSELEATHIELITRFSGVAENWSKLNTANNSKDVATFEEAEKAFSVEYEAIRSLSGEFASTLSSTQAKVISSYNSSK